MLVYDANRLLFLRQEIEQISGKNDGVAQAFYANKHIDFNMSMIQPFSFDIPMYTTNVGTMFYCGQQPFSVYTNTVKPSIKFIFTANTSSFGTGLTMIHDIYKIDYSSYQNCANYINSNCKTLRLAPPPQGVYKVSDEKLGLKATSEIGYDGTIKAEGQYSGVSLSLQQTQTKTYNINCNARGVVVILTQNPGGAYKASTEYKGVKITLVQNPGGACEISGEYGDNTVTVRKPIGITPSLSTTSRGVKIVLTQNPEGACRTTGEYRGVSITLDINYSEANKTTVESQGIEVSLTQNQEGTCEAIGESRGIKIVLTQDPSGACEITGELSGTKVSLMQDPSGACKIPCNIETLTTTPILSITGQTSGITGVNYYLSPDEYYKQLGKTSYQLFEDKAQYFIDTKFSFYRTSGIDYTSDFYVLDDNYNPKLSTYNNTIKEVTVNPRITISAGTFSGITVVGNFFSYILMPNKPTIEEPYVEGTLNTYSPTFYFSSVDDGDEYLIQIAYTPVTATAFTGTIYSYPITKEASALSTKEMIERGTGDWTIPEEITDLVRKYTIPVKPKKNFWYRIGNVRTLTNIFDVKQSVVSFSDVYSATTSSYSLSGYVQTKADSVCTNISPDYSDPGYLDDDIETLYYLSGTVRGSVVNAAVMQLVYPNGNYITQNTSSVGSFRFDGLTSGNYILNTYYRGYLDDSRTISIIGDTLLTFKLKLLWGNSADIWGKMADENYFL